MSTPSWTSLSLSSLSAIASQVGQKVTSFAEKTLDDEVDNSERNSIEIEQKQPDQPKPTATKSALQTPSYPPSKSVPVPETSNSGTPPDAIVSSLHAKLSKASDFIKKLNSD